ncbi:pesticin C-terminus-like muramidase [Salmonella enterica]|nr:pesticin C-terminus-like muramidase [Salmonella enterica]EJF4143906.1 hypothetical protein [Salmonella enterica]
MADGTIVAYRINNDYLKGSWKGQQLCYSSTFVLVKSLCQPDPQKKESWLEFYSLYMHLAPVKDYPASPCYKVRDGHSGIRLRQYREGEYGLPDGQESGDTQVYQAPRSAGKSLNAGDCVVSSRTGRFYVTKNNEATLTTFGLVRLLKGETAGNEQYWVTLDPELMEPDGEIQALMPAWMQKAKERGVFNSVQTVEETDEWKVSAGAPVGFMGCGEYPGEGGGQVDREWFVHLEVLSADPKMPTFLSNPAGVKGEKRTVLAPKGKILYTRQTTAEQETFTATSATLGAQCVRPRNATTPVRDESQTLWYNITGSGWLPEKDIEEAGQYDLLKLGFQPLEENSSGDMTNSPYEGWVPEAFGSVSRAAEQGDEWYEQVPPFYRELVTAMDRDHNGKVTEEEIRQALVVRDPLVRNVVNRLVVKHHSEWCRGRSSGRWEGFYKELDREEVGYCEKWQSDLEWMSGVSPFNNDEPVWHFHPVVFLDVIADKSTDVIEFETTLGIYRISRKSANFILQEEGYKEHPYVPENSSASGVTLGYGYDLGQQTVGSMRATISDFYTEQQLSRLESVVGLSGQAARNSLSGIIDITINKDDATILAMKMKSTYAQTVVNTYPEVLNTHPHCQGALLSLVINRGTSFTIPSPEARIEMKNIQIDFSQGELNDIPTQIRAMKRLWEGRGLNGLIKRREGEAKLFEEGLAQ